MKKNFIITILFCILGLSSYIGYNFVMSNDTHLLDKNIIQPVSEGHSIDSIDNLDKILSYSTNIVKAQLLSQKDFDGFVNVYTFSLDEDYTNNTSKEINMYDVYNERYIVGHSYYLFLESSNSALYPHTIYTTVKDDLIIDATLGQTIEDVFGYGAAQMFVSENKLDITNVLNNNIVGTKVCADTITISDETNISSIVNESDVVAIIQISDEEMINQYASTYTVDLVDTLKGSENAVGQYMILPPNMDVNTHYYVFLKENSAHSGTYLLFSRAMPVLEATEENVSEVSMILE